MLGRRKLTLPVKLDCLWCDRLPHTSYCLVHVLYLHTPGYLGREEILYFLKRGLLYDELL